MLSKYVYLKNTTSVTFVCAVLGCYLFAFMIMKFVLCCVSTYVQQLFFEFCVKFVWTVLGYLFAFMIIEICSVFRLHICETTILWITKYLQNLIWYSFIWQKLQEFHFVTVGEHDVWDKDTSYMSSLDSTRWLEVVCGCLNVARDVAECMTGKKHQSVIIQGKKKWLSFTACFKTR